MILALETATDICSVALVNDGTVIAERSVHRKNVHSEMVLSLVEESVKTSGITLLRLSAVAVSIGPGSFTGLRIGLSTAKGLAMALSLPIIAVPTLDGIAEAYRRTRSAVADELFFSMIDAKREEAFYALYSVTTTGIFRTSDYAITLRSDILADAERRGARREQPVISAGAVGLLGERKKSEFLVQDFTQLEPLYLRDFVATLPKKKV